MFASSVDAPEIPSLVSHSSIVGTEVSPCSIALPYIPWYICWSNSVGVGACSTIVSSTISVGGAVAIVVSEDTISSCSVNVESVGTDSGCCVDK